MKVTCKECVPVDPTFQECLDTLVGAWDNIGYTMWANSIHCPCCGKRLTEVEE